MLVTVANAAWNYCRRLNKEKYIYVYIYIYIYARIDIIRLLWNC